jgi:hypothetical protein
MKTSLRRSRLFHVECDLRFRTEYSEQFNIADLSRSESVEYNLWPFLILVSADVTSPSLLIEPEARKIGYFLLIAF